MPVVRLRHFVSSYGQQTRKPSLHASPVVGEFHMLASDLVDRTGSTRSERLDTARLLGHPASQLVL